MPNRRTQPLPISDPCPPKRDLDWADVERDALNDPSHPGNQMSGNPDNVDLQVLLDAILPILAGQNVHPKTFMDQMMVSLAEDTYGRGGFEQFNIRDAEGELWGYTVGIADED